MGVGGSKLEEYDKQPKFNLEESLTIEEYERLLKESDFPIALTTYGDHFVSMNKKFAQEFGFQNVQEALSQFQNFATEKNRNLLLHEPKKIKEQAFSRYCPEKQVEFHNNQSSEELAHEEAKRAWFESEDGIVTFNWEILKPKEPQRISAVKPVTYRPVEEKVEPKEKEKEKEKEEGKNLEKIKVFKTVVANAMLYENYLAFQIVLLPFDKEKSLENTKKEIKEKLSKVLRPIEILDLSLSKAFEKEKPMYTGYMNVLRGASRDNKFKYYFCEIDYTGQNLLLFKEPSEKVPKHIIPIQSNSALKEPAKQTTSTFAQTEEDQEKLKASLELKGSGIPVFFSSENKKQLDLFTYTIKKAVTQRINVSKKPFKQLVDNWIEEKLKDEILAFEMYSDDLIVTTENLENICVSKKSNRKHLYKKLEKIEFIPEDKKAGLEVGRSLFDEKQKLSATEFRYHYKEQETGNEVDQMKLFLCHWNDQGKIYRQDTFFCKEFTKNLLPSPEELKNFKNKTENLMTSTKKFKNVRDIEKKSTRPCLDTYINFLKKTHETTDDFIKALEETFDKSIEVVTTDKNGQNVVGYKQNIQRTKKWVENIKWKEYPRIERNLINGCLALVEVHLSFEKPDGIHCDRQHIDLMVVRNGKIIRKDSYFTEKHPSISEGETK